MTYATSHEFDACDKTCRLSVPDETILKSILVEVEMMPENATCVIYGIDANGQSACVTVSGSHSEIDLPFSSPQICIRHDDDVQVRIGTIGYKDQLH